MSKPTKMDDEELKDLWEEEQEEKESDQWDQWDDGEYVTKKAYKELQSNIERGMQKVLKVSKEREKKEHLLERVLDEVWNVAQDQSHLIKISEKEPEVAQMILDRYYNGISIDDFEEQITGERKTPKLDPNKIKQEAKEEIRRELNDESVKKKLSKVIEKLWLKWEELKKFKSNYEELTEGKTISQDNVKRYIKLAHIETFWMTPSDSERKIAQVMASWWSSASSPSQKKGKEESMLDDMRKFMSNHWYKNWVN